MTPDDDADALAKLEQKIICDAASALQEMRADPSQVARNLISVAVFLVGDDAAARTQLGVDLIRTALSLDPDLARVRFQ